MRLTRDTLIEKAMEIVDEAIKACDARPIEPTLGLRFALTFLYACSNGDRACYEDFLREIQDPQAGAPGAMASYRRTTYSRTHRTGIARSVGLIP